MFNLVANRGKRGWGKKAKKIASASLPCLGGGGRRIDRTIFYPPPQKEEMTASEIESWMLKKNTESALEKKGKSCVLH